MHSQHKRFALAFALLPGAFALAQETTFTKITTGDIVNDGGWSNGSSWGDYDNDSDLDLFVANSGNNLLYQNNGNGGFAKITQGAIVTDGGNFSSSSWGDYDNDGDLDLFVANSGENNFLYQNNGNGSFTKITQGAIVNDGGFSFGSSWGDYDNDGDLDLYVANGFFDGENNFLYQNNGNGSSTKITKGAIVNDGGFSFGSSWGDYDNDGDLDLFVANSGNNFLYQNNGNGSFTKVTEGAIVTDGGSSRGSSWGDYDNDGDLDLFVANLGENNFLYQNNDNGGFTKITQGAIVTDGGRSYGSSWGDYDNDGDLDLFVANCCGENNFLYQNNDDGTFTKITQSTIVTDGGSSRGSSWSDYDNDGDLDLFVANSGENNFLYQNNGNNNNSINIRLIGVVSNSSAIGAKVRVKAKIGSKLVWQMQEVSGQTGYASQNSLNAEFGLGTATMVDSIRVQWHSGLVQDTANVAVNQFLTIEEIPFTRITTGAIVTDGGSSRGSSWGDYDNDGDLDLFVANLGENNFLYQNNDNGNFAKITQGAIVNDGGTSYSSSWGDYDNDGDLDLFVANCCGENNLLYQNDGNGSFTKITQGTIVTDGGDSRGSSWGDYDNDGDLDLFVANYFEENNFLYQNDGYGNFTKITQGAIVNDGGDSIGSSWGDYDNDGDLDLFVANYFDNNFLYQNNGNGSFVKITEGVIVTDGGNSQGSSWGDYDNDGDLDLFVANDRNNSLYQNNGNGNFAKIAEGAIVTDVGNSIGSSWGDCDNDGDLDLFVANYRENNFLYQNNGNGTFTKITSSAIVTHGGDSRGSSWGDYDNDGDLDLFVAYLGDNVLYQNNLYGSHWIDVQLEGTVSNTSGIGAKVRVQARIGETPVWQMQELSGQTGLGGQNSLNAEFGLKKAAIVDSIQIRWPYRDAPVNFYTNVAVNQFITYRENNRPRVTRSIADINLSLAGGDSVLDLKAAPTLFEDLDHDTLVYSAHSSNDQIAAASISGSLLTVSLVDDKFPGRCQIKISADDGRADDGRGNTEETSFEINRPPLLFRPIANLTLTVSDTSRRFVANLREVFLDPDGDVLSYDLINSNPSVALVDTSGTVIFATPGDSTGEATITVFADDFRGGTLSTSFKITNAGLNTPPRLAGSGIADQALIIAGRPFIQPLYEVFTDAEGDSLNFALRNSNRDVAFAAVESDTLTVVPIALGSAQITVTANDGKGGEVSTTFRVQVVRSRPPFIAHSPNAQPHAQQTRFEVSAMIVEDEGLLSEAFLWYRVAGRIGFERVDMEATSINDTTLLVTGSIPAETFRSQGAEYYLEVRDNYSVRSRLPMSESGVFSVRVRAEGEGISNLRPQPAGGEQTSYHLFSVPFDLDNKSAGAVITDDLGAPDIRQWRFLELVMDATTGAISYPEFPNTAPLAPGKAFWLIIRKSGRYIDTGPGTSVPTSQPFAIALQKGWNLVGNPFNFPAYTTDALSNGDPLRFFAYEAGAWSDTLTALSRPWQPFEGYAVYANAACSLYVDPDPSRSTALTKPGSTTDSDALWSIRIRGQCQQAKDGNTIAAIHKRALPAWDRLDHPEPPVIGEYVSVYFPHREWHTLAKTYCLDARPEPSEGEVWDFEVKTNIRDKVHLTFAGIETVPPEFEVYLTDDALRITQNLRESNSYTIAGSENPKSLKLVVGKKGFIEDKFAGLQVVPTHYELSQNFPNPFNPVTTIRYGLPQAGRVSLRIYNLLGEEVATLVDDKQRAAGYHVAIWDGRDKIGNAVASGIYVYRIQAADFVMTRKMAMIK